MTLFENFDTGSVFTSGDTANWSRVTTAPPPQAGTHSLKRESGNTGYASIWDPATAVPRDVGVVVGAWVRGITGFITAPWGGIYLGTGTVDAGYQCFVDHRTGQPLIRIMKDAGTTGQVLSGNNAVSRLDTWLWEEVDFPASDQIRVRVYDAPGGTLLDTATRTDASYTSLLLGLCAYSNVAVDGVDLTIPAPAPTIYYSADGVTSVPAELYYSADGVTSVRVDLIT